MQDQDKVLKKLSVQRRVLRVGYIVSVVMFVACIAALLRSMTLALILLNTAVIFYVFVMRTLDRHYNMTFIKANLCLATAKCKESACVTRKGETCIKELADTRLLPVEEQNAGARSTLCLTSQGSGVTETIREISCYYKLEQHDRHKVGLLNGVWINIRDERFKGSGLALIQKGMLEESICPEWYLENGFHEIAIEHPQLAREFYLFGTSALDDVVSESFLLYSKDLIRKAQEHESTLAVGTYDGGAAVFLRGRSLMVTTPISEPVSEKVLTFDRVPEARLLGNVIDAMRKCVGRHMEC